MELCTVANEKSVVNKAIKCLTNQYLPIDEVNSYFVETDCRKLVITKLEINKQVSYDILKLNKHQVRNDNKKLFRQDQRTKYDKLLEAIMVNLGFLERIWKKWPSKTKDAEWK